jgi:hypothetical protein
MDQMVIKMEKINNLKYSKEPLVLKLEGSLLFIIQYSHKNINKEKLHPYQPV